MHSRRGEAPAADKDLQQLRPLLRTYGTERCCSPAERPHCSLICVLQNHWIPQLKLDAAVFEHGTNRLCDEPFRYVFHSCGRPPSHQSLIPLRAVADDADTFATE